MMSVLRAGALGYVRKDAEPEILLAAVGADDGSLECIRGGMRTCSMAPGAARGTDQPACQQVLVHIN